MTYLPDLGGVYLALYIFLFICGACVGSFLNVVIYRLPLHISFITGRSFCPACRQQLRSNDLMPIISWLLLKGRCRYCGAAISPRYMLVEILTGLLGVATAAVYGLSWTALAVFALAAGLVAVAFIDWDTMEIPNGLVIFLAAPALALCLLLPGVTVTSHIIGFFCVSLLLLAVALLVNGAFGGGDIKLMAVCGLALGWQLTLVSFFFSLLLGGVYAVGLLAARKAGRKTQFAFGPFLALGVILAVLIGADVIKWYLELFKFFS